MKRALLLLLVISACKKEEPPHEDPPRRVLSVVAHDSVQGQRTFPGTLEARYATQLAFRVGGRVTKRLVSIGDVVKKGDVIATLDSTALAAGALAAQANVEASDARRINADRTRERQAKLLEQNATPQSRVDDATSGRDTADASVAEARARLNKAREDLSYGTLRADFDGVITKVSFEVEQTVAANQIIAEMARPDVVDVVVDVAEKIADNLEVDAPVEIKSSTEPPVQSNGKIRQMSPAADQLTRTYRVWVALPAPPEKLRLGTTMYATFAEDYPAAVRVPNEAVYDKDNGTFVWVVEGESVHERAVKTADRKGKRAVVTEGIRDGERVVIAGVHQLKEGQKVIVGEDK